MTKKLIHINSGTCKHHHLMDGLASGIRNIKPITFYHYNHVKMSAMASQITRLAIVYSSDQRKRHWPLWVEFTGEFPAHKASNAKKCSIWWRHHATQTSLLPLPNSTTDRREPNNSFVMNASQCINSWDPSCTCNMTSWFGRCQSLNRDFPCLWATILHRGTEKTLCNSYKLNVENLQIISWYDSSWCSNNLWWRSLLGWRVKS